MTNKYIDNKRMYEELVKYNDKMRAFKDDGKNKPRISNYIGECFMLIANRLSSRPQFAKYIFKEEMIGDAIENCVIYIHNFDDKKYTNPFAYFTQIIYYVFLRRIYKEKRQLYIKHKTSENTMLFDREFNEDDLNDMDLDGKFFNDIMQGNEKMNDIVKGFEATLTKKKNKRKVKNELPIEELKMEVIPEVLKIMEIRDDD